ncbi:hypothetical protein [Methylobacter sp. S3L5C]|uniref:hypothetical protein n=1 Tax=Methylobacter sp. S3L5C TaxID=2839024 RepID=UPI001FADC026|nr:hypothetical protein [Methylobacter sp. S3L5C]UOA08157.1 hypothetical protein KKZ03_18400 [Methylobacter sp. S3L5C]
MLDNAGSLFEGKRGPKPVNAQSDPDRLYAKIGMEKTFKDLQARETGQVSRINHLQKELNKMEDRVMADERHKEAQRRYKKGLAECPIALMVFDDYPPNDEQIVVWKKLLKWTPITDPKNRLFNVASVIARLILHYHYNYLNRVSDSVTR